MTGASEATDEQLALVRARSRAARPKPPALPATERPIAQVALDVHHAHLDRPFDYLVPEPMAADAAPGCRVRVRFAGRLVDGFILERIESSDHPGRLSPLARVVSPVSVLTSEIATLARLVADRYAGSLADVLRLAIPPRHAAVERQPPAPRTPGALQPLAGGTPWSSYRAGPSLIAALARGEAPRAVWVALPGPSVWAVAIADAVRATVSSGRTAVVVVPDQHDVAHLDAALTAALGPQVHTTLTAELGVAERYRRFLACLRGDVRAVVGTRAAAFAPLPALGLVVCWDDGDDLHEEPRAPYSHVREVLALRAHAAGAGALVGGFAMTAEGAQLVATGWARSLAADRASVRAIAPRVVVAGDDTELARDPVARTARLPALAWETARDGLATGAVLVQVPRAGYLPVLACARCRAAARCVACSGPLALASGHAVAACRWCGRLAPRCPTCGHAGFRAQVVGASRTAEELGRAFPGVPVVSSSGDDHRRELPARPALVVATPGAEPVVAGGYPAALLLDGWALVDRADLRAGEEALRRWLNAAALVRPGGRVIVHADPALRPVQALVRWDPAGHAERELAERAALGFPPAVRMAALDGTADAVRDLLDHADLPAAAQVLGPVPETSDRVRALVRVPRSTGPALAIALRNAQGVRSARKAPDPVRIEIDPHPLG